MQKVNTCGLNTSGYAGAEAAPSKTPVFLSFFDFECFKGMKEKALYSGYLERESWKQQSSQASQVSACLKKKTRCCTHLILFQ